MPFIEVDNLRFHVQRSGDGPDVVLIHGLTGDLSIWFLCDAFRVLGATRRVTAYDLRGHGYSDAPETNYTSADHARDLIGVMDALGIDRAQVVGHSFGAVIALHAIAAHPDRFVSAVLSDPYFPALRHLEDLSRWGHWRAFQEEALDAGVTLSAEHWYDIGKFFDQIAHLDDEALLKFRHAVGLPALNRLTRLGKTTCGHDSKLEAGLTADLIRGVSIPIFALYGEFSPFLATAGYLVDQLADCRQNIVPDAKHRAPEENPKAFVRLVDEFLIRTTRATTESSRVGAIAESRS